MDRWRASKTKLHKLDSWFLLTKFFGTKKYILSQFLYFNIYKIFYKVYFIPIFSQFFADVSYEGV